MTCPLFQAILSTLAATIVAVSTPPGPGASAGGQTEDGLAGEWDGEFPRLGAPLRLLLRFEHGAHGWNGGLEIAGSPPVALEELRWEPPHLRFVAPIDGPVLFEGRVEGARLELGLELGETMELAFEHLPTRPVPSSRAEAWRQDLDVVARRFLAYDRSFDEAARARAREELAELGAAVDTLDDPHVIVRLAEIVASSDNAHTRLYLLRNRTELRRLPIRTWWFGDELRIVSTTQDGRSLLGARVRTLGGHDVGEVAAAVGALFAGNASWHRYKSCYFLTAPEVLLGLDLIPDPEHVTLEVEDGEGRRSVVLSPLPLVRSRQALEAWRDLLPGAAPWVGMRDGREPPLYLAHPDENYFLEPLEDGRVLYLCYRRSQEQEGRPFGDFRRQVETALEGEKVERLVVDLRLNTGGDLEIGWELFEALASHPRLAAPGRLVVLTGRATFSAGITHAAQLSRNEHVLRIGEPVGDALDSWAEGGNLVLPNCGLTVHYANGFHGYSRIPYPEREPFFRDLSVDSLAPHRVVEPSWEDFLAARDPLLEAALAR